MPCFYVGPTPRQMPIVGTAHRLVGGDDAFVTGISRLRPPESPNEEATEEATGKPIGPRSTKRLCQVVGGNEVCEFLQVRGSGGSSPWESGVIARPVPLSS